MMLVTILRMILGISGMIIAAQCLWLILSGKINFGTLVPLFIGSALLIHGLFWHAIYHLVSQSFVLSMIWHALWGLFILWLLSFIAFGYTLQKSHQSRSDRPDVVAIIVLGTSVIDNKPTPALVSRLDTAADVSQAHPDALIITSGGVGFNRTRSEASVMADYLRDHHGIKEYRIKREEESTSTEENFANSKAILKDNNIPLSAPIAVVTNDFHIRRAIAIARHQGYQQPVAIPSPTPLSMRYNAWFREYFAFISGWLLQEY